jgi:hypothetical protein
MIELGKFYVIKKEENKPVDSQDQLQVNHQRLLASYFADRILLIPMKGPVEIVYPYKKETRKVDAVCSYVWEVVDGKRPQKLGLDGLMHEMWLIETAEDWLEPAKVDDLGDGWRCVHTRAGSVMVKSDAESFVMNQVKIKAEGI